MTIDEQKDNRINVTEFLKDNSSLFVILGVFSALSIYISDLGGGSVGNATTEIRVGFGGSLLLALLLILLIYRQLIDRAGSLENLLKLHTKLTNWDLIVFTGGLLLLLPSLIHPIIQEVVALYYIMGTLIFFLLINIIFRVFLKIEQILPKKGIPRHAMVISLTLASIYSFDMLSNYINSNPQLIGVGPFSLSNIYPVIIDAISVLSIGIYGVSLAILVESVTKLLDIFGELYQDFRS